MVHQLLQHRQCSPRNEACLAEAVILAPVLLVIARTALLS